MQRCLHFGSSGQCGENGLKLGEKEWKPQDPPGDHFSGQQDMPWFAEVVTVKIKSRDDLGVSTDK